MLSSTQALPKLSRSPSRSPQPKVCSTRVSALNTFMLTAGRCAALLQQVAQYW